MRYDEYFIHTYVYAEITRMCEGKEIARLITIGKKELV
jgi:hypothetical protein